MVLLQIGNVLLFKAENKILLHNGGIYFYLLQLKVILNLPPVFQILCWSSAVSYVTQRTDGE